MSPKKSSGKAKVDKPRLVIFDGHGIIFRSYYAFREPLTVRKTGEVVSAVFGFANTLLTVLNELKPTHVAVALDPPGPTFRHQKDATYKANRFDALKGKVLALIAEANAPDDAKEALARGVEKATNSEEVRTHVLEGVAKLDVSKKVKEELGGAAEPAERLREIGVQTERVRELIGAFGIPIYMEKGYEADDVLGTLALQAKEAGAETYLVTLDNDIIQLVREDVKVFMMRPYQHDTVVYDEKAARERFQIEPQQMPDFKGLKGDTSDNIPGVPGVGDKTAVKLIQQFGGIEEIYKHLEDIKPEKLREKLREHEVLARHSKEMAVLDTSAPVMLDLDQAAFASYDRDSVIDLFTELEFRSLVPRLPATEAASKGNGRDVEAKPAEDVDYDAIYTNQELDALVKRLRSAKTFAFAIETAEQNALRSPIAGIALSWAAGKAAYVPVGHRPGLGDREQLTLKDVLAKLGPLFEDEKIAKVAHNIKVDIEVLATNGVELGGEAFDTLIASYLLGDGGGDSNKPGARADALKWLAAKRLGVEMAPLADLVGTGAKRVSIADVTVEQAVPFACAGADMTGRLRPSLEADLKERDLWPLFSEMEMPLVPVLARMEEAGVAVDAEALREMSLSLGEQVSQLEREAYDSVGHEFNLGSPQQLSQLFFEELRLPKTRKTKQGYTTDATALEGLRGAHAVVDILLEWRQLTKLKSTYIDALPALVNPKTGRIHTYYNQTVAATGRLSSQDPNLQNIPVRTDLGNAIRRTFVARDFGPKPVLLAADYSQIELRILAHLSKDARLLESFHNDEDIHAATASQVFDVKLSKVTTEQRRRAKVFNFGVLYGLSEFGLATREGVSREEAAGFIETYFEKYPKVREWREGVIASCRELGYAETMAGRRRLVPEIRSSNFQVRSGAERIAINMPAQGTASDIIKIAMNRIDAELRERDLTTKMILQVHDELIFEGPTKERDDVQELVLRIMPQSLELDVPLKIDIKVGKNWGELEEVAAEAKG